MTSSVSLPVELLADLGVTAWQLKPGFQKLDLIDQAESRLDADANPTGVGGQMSETASHKPALTWVLLGSGLSVLWQQPENQAWLLWNAIMQFHLDDFQQMRYFDTADLQTEDQQFEALEQIIELGVDRVFTMDAEHPINEMLAEGAQVIMLPHFEQLIEQPLLKREVYFALIQAGLVKVIA
ncbi:hypothetical protein JX580_09120 [Thiomicrospira microaerophila]|uniref:hypothetical protein n=1 Tax=Thiomicrospira microaerophila TaxID=406020 RepID=UPI00200BD652|nr:hypothetical protein [Thiomicrospira microaerophila]UQB41823.1 hypothetical protein JX580_09120 [Thiomicrospira microaerophila]